MSAMWVSVPLKQVDGGGSYELRLELDEAGASVSSAQQLSTTAALLGYFDEMARTDQELSEERTQFLRYRRDESETGDVLEEEEKEAQESARSAELMGRRVRDIGDEFMVQLYGNPRLSSMVDAMVTESRERSASKTAFEHFCEAVNILLGCDEFGAAQTISIGRIAALFSYCYHLCKVFIRRRGITGVVVFLGQLLSYLIRSLYRSRFYEWLSSRGGWSQLLKQTYQITPLLSSSPYVMAPVVIGGVVLLGFIALKYFKS